MKKATVKKFSAPGYAIKSIWRTMIVPPFVKRLQRKIVLRGWEKRPDADYIRRRLDYCCPIKEEFHVGGEGKRIKDFSLKNTHSAYFFDIMRYLRAFPTEKRIAIINGDTHFNPDHIVLGKARRLDEKRGNVALMDVDRRRLVVEVDDPIPFDEKRGVLIYRGDVDAKENRKEFLRRWWGHPLFDLGDTSPRTESPWKAPRVSIPDHLKYKYVLTLEGHDITSALRWVLSSNCVPVMPRPTAECWLLEGLMEPGVHYIEIRPDFSDAAEKIEWYNAHPEEARKISEASKSWLTQFSDPRREQILHYLIADRYLRFAH